MCLLFLQSPSCYQCLQQLYSYLMGLFVSPFCSWEIYFDCILTCFSDREEEGAQTACCFADRITSSSPMWVCRHYCMLNSPLSACSSHSVVTVVLSSSRSTKYHQTGSFNCYTVKSRAVKRIHILYLSRSIDTRVWHTFLEVQVSTQAFYSSKIY